MYNTSSYLKILYSENEIFLHKRATPFSKLAQNSKKLIRLCDTSNCRFSMMLNTNRMSFIEKGPSNVPSRLPNLHQIYPKEIWVTCSVK